jgi:hypothetical protein
MHWFLKQGEPPRDPTKGSGSGVNSIGLAIMGKGAREGGARAGGYSDEDDYDD